MPTDQAADLRRLIRTDGLSFAESRADSPLLWTVAGGKGGVGATTAAVNLAAALALSGQRTLLIDAHRNGPDASALCGAADGPGIGDVLSGRRSVHEVLQRGPAGMLVLPGRWAGDEEVEHAAPGHDRLLRELRALGAHVDVLIADVGSGQDRLQRGLWQAADGLLLVTSPDALSIMNGYAAIKVLRPSGGAQLCSLVNLADDAAAAEVHARLARSCHRFLGRQVVAAGELPCDSRVAAAAAARRPFALDRGAAGLARRMEQLAETLLDLSAARAGNDCGRRPAAQRADRDRRGFVPSCDFGSTPEGRAVDN